MHMILTSIDCKRTGRGIEDCCKADSIQRCAVESIPLCYVWLLGFDWTRHTLHDCHRRLRGWREYILVTVGDCQIFEGASKYAMKYHTFRPRHVQATYALMSCKNNNEWNLSVEKPFHVRNQIRSSSLSVINEMTQCVSSSLPLNTPPIKHLLSREQEPLDSITRVQVGLGVEGHVPSPSLVCLNKVFPAISQFSQL